MTSSWTVTARKRRPCHDRPCAGTGWIEAGDDYWRGVAFPGDEVNDTEHLWVMVLCQPCATQYGRAMPPRRTKARA